MLFREWYCQFMQVPLKCGSCENAAVVVAMALSAETGEMDWAERGALYGGAC